MATPKVVDAMPELAWLSIDDAVWFTGNVVDGAEPEQVLAVHVNPSTGEQCRRAPRSIGKHTIVSRTPLTLKPSLACDEPSCTWHGFVRAGHWVPA